MSVLANGPRLFTFFTLAVVACACGDRSPLGPGPDVQAAYDRGPQEVQARNRPFHGNTRGSVVDQVFPAPAGRCPAYLPVLFVYEGEGTATHLGNFQVEGSECVFMDPTNPANVASGMGRFIWTAANGDELHVAYDATIVTPPAPGSPWLSWSAPIYVTGGTGRFANAQVSNVVWEGGANILTLETYSSFDGWIAYQASDRSR